MNPKRAEVIAENTGSADQSKPHSPVIPGLTKKPSAGNCF
jgi:hypothetical protein